MKKTGNFNSYVKAYFTFSKGERNGIIFLVILLVLIIIGIKLIPESHSQIDPHNFSVFKKQVDSLFVEKDTFQESSGRRSDHAPVSKIEKYEERTQVLLNSCDSFLLTKLPGIGPVLASRIIKYRNLLGGYYSLQQLKEVYGLKEENFNKAKDLIVLDIKNIKKFSIDTAGFKTLVRHPYIGKDMAWRIINLRKKSKEVNISKDYFTSNQIGDSAQWVKLEPYIILQKNTVSE